ASRPRFFLHVSSPRQATARRRAVWYRKSVHGPICPCTILLLPSYSLPCSKNPCVRLSADSIVLILMFPQTPVPEGDCRRLGAAKEEEPVVKRNTERVVQ